MTKETRNTLMDIIDERCPATNVLQTVEWLNKHNLLNISHCQALVAQYLVEQALYSGMAKVDAMVFVAEKMGCSYECVRKYVYIKRG